jgi:hypothetical protein
MPRLTGNNIPFIGTESVSRSEITGSLRLYGCDSLGALTVQTLATPLLRDLAVYRQDLAVYRQILAVYRHIQNRPRILAVCSQFLAVYSQNGSALF